MIEWEEKIFPLTTTLMKGKIMSETKSKYLQIRDELQKFSDENYDDLIKAIISFELCEENEIILNRLMEFYMHNDDCRLLNDTLHERLRYERFRCHEQETKNLTESMQETEIMENTLQVVKSIQNYLIKMQDEFEIQNHWLARLTQAIEMKE